MERLAQATSSETGTAVLADGSTTASRRYTIHKMSVGNHTVSDVVAGVAPIKAAPLLGQSSLSKLPAWAIDYVQSALVFNPQLADYESQLAIYKTRLTEYEKLGTAASVAARLPHCPPPGLRPHPVPPRPCLGAACPSGMHFRGGPVSP